MLHISFCFVSFYATGTSELRSDLRYVRLELVVPCRLSYISRISFSYINPANRNHTSRPVKVFSMYLRVQLHKRGEARLDLGERCFTVIGAQVMMQLLTVHFRLWLVWRTKTISFPFMELSQKSFISSCSWTRLSQSCVHGHKNDNWAACPHYKTAMKVLMGEKVHTWWRESSEVICFCFKTIL